MKKTIFFGLVFLVGCNLQTIAATGAAYDGLYFLLVIVGFLFIIIGFFSLIDFIKRNGNTILKKLNEIYQRFIKLVRHFIKYFYSIVFHQQFKNLLNINDNDVCN